MVDPLSSSSSSSSSSTSASKTSLAALFLDERLGVAAGTCSLEVVGGRVDGLRISSGRSCTGLAPNSSTTILGGGETTGSSTCWDDDI